MPDAQGDTGRLYRSRSVWELQSNRRSIEQSIKLQEGHRMNHMEDRIQTVRPPPPRHVSTAGLRMVDPTDAEVQVSITINDNLVHVWLMSALGAERTVHLPT